MSIKTMQRALSAAKVADLYIKEKITGSENRKMAQQFLAKSNAELRAAIEQAHESRQWQGLTDEDVDEIERWIEFKEDGSGRIPNQKLVRYIERKLKEKNA